MRNVMCFGSKDVKRAEDLNHIRWKPSKCELRSIKRMTEEEVHPRVNTLGNGMVFVTVHNGNGQLRYSSNEDFSPEGLSSMKKMMEGNNLLDVGDRNAKAIKEIRLNDGFELSTLMTGTQTLEGDIQNIGTRDIQVIGTFVKKEYTADGKTVHFSYDIYQGEDGSCVLHGFTYTATIQEEGEAQRTTTRSETIRNIFNQALCGAKNILIARDVDLVNNWVVFGLDGTPTYIQRITGSTELVCSKVKEPATLEKGQEILGVDLSKVVLDVPETLKRIMDAVIKGVYEPIEKLAAFVTRS